MGSVERSQELFAEATSMLPGGVSSPVRAFKAVGGSPLFIDRAAGARLWDVDGNEYVDYVLSWGPLILGHAHPVVVDAVRQAAAKGTSYGAPCADELELAKLIREFMPSIEMVRFVNSGTEATMSALRLARAATGRDKIVKFEGCYHGHADALLVKAGSGVATLGLPDSPGVPAATARDTLVVPFNDLAAVEEVFSRNAEEIAAVMVEPVAGNMGVVLPNDGFLSGLRDLTTNHGTLLVFDEVMTGFRVAPGGAQQVFGVVPDLTTLGKVIGGGLPVGAYGGRRSLMDLVAPAGTVYQAGTLSGNPLAMAAGVATLTEMRREGLWDGVATTTGEVAEAFAQAARASGVPIQQNRLGTMFSTFFTDDPVTDWRTASAADRRRFASVFRSMLAEGVYLAPSPFEACFVSSAHTDDDVARTARAAARALSSL